MEMTPDSLIEMRLDNQKKSLKKRMRDFMKNMKILVLFRSQLK